MKRGELNHQDYLGLVRQLKGMPFELATELHGQLTAKYYAYVDKAIQCNKAVEEFEQIAGRVRNHQGPPKLLTE